MANPFVQNEIYEVELVDPRDDEKWTATMRVLNAGDRAALQDETVIEEDSSGEDRARVPMGRLRMLAVERALVSWTLPLPVSSEAIHCLHEDLFDQLYKNVRTSTEAATTGPPTGPQTDALKPAPLAAADS